MSLHLRGIVALLIVTLVWGTTFPAMKDLLAWLPPVWIVFLRFVVAGLVLAPGLRRAKLADCKIGAVLGVLLFFCFVLQLEGLTLISANRNAFITGLNVLVVPLLGLLAGRWPERRIILGVGLALAGLFALCWDGGAWGRGDSLTLFSALAFGVYVKLMEHGTRKAEHVQTLAVVQMLVVALCAGLWLWLIEVPQTRIDISSDAANYYEYIADGIRLHWVNLLYLALVATAFIISLQTWGQSHASANEAALIYAFEPACAAIAAWFWLGEAMTPRGWLGAALLIGGVIVSQWQHASAKPLLVPD
jgi:drug/metabolite transporter (DMT)-like permease